MKNFALIGVAGYIAPKHLKAIKDTKNNLLAVLDKFDSVGILDRYFPNADFFIEFERFDRHIEKLKRGKNIKLDYVSICTPNYLHDAHIRMALRREADAICEKPLVLNPWNLDALLNIEKETKNKVYTILQLRLHPSIIALKEKIAKSSKDKIYEVNLTYITSRGNWYFTSWKGDVSKSGGIASNIGVHFYDMLSWVFGDVIKNKVHLRSHDRAAGYLEFEKAKVKWFLSTDFEMLPRKTKAEGHSTYRSVMVDGEKIEFSKDFTGLHTKSYQKILNGNGFGLEDARKSINIIHTIRNSAISEKESGEFHPFVNFPSPKHPFKRNDF